MNILDIIKSYDITNTSFILAAHDIAYQGDIGEQRYRDRITEMTMQDTTDIPFELVPLMYGYVIQEAIRTSYRTQELYNYAKDKAVSFFDKNKYVWAVKEEDVKIDIVTGEVKQKKGKKGELALEAFRANLAALRDGSLTRKGMLDIMVEKAGMSQACASTYYAKYKKDYQC